MISPRRSPPVVIVVVVVVIVIAAAAIACGKPPDAAVAKAAPAPIDVKLDEVTSQAVPRTLTLTGSVVADRSSEVAANVSGRVVVAAVERGQSVKAGDVLVRVDNLVASLSAEVATAQSKSADAQVDLATKECARTEALYQKGAITAADYDRQKTACTAQLFSAQAAKANVGLATKAAGDTSIRAPFDGVIGERYVNVGEYVQPSTKVASLMSIAPVRVSISVPESAVSMIKPDQVLAVQVSAYPDATFPAKVRFVAPALRANSRDLVVEAVCENKDKLLKPGMFATVRLNTGDEDRPTVPAGDVRHDGSASMVFIAKDGHAVETVIQPGQTTKDDRVPILGGLASGDQVIADPPATLKDGAAIAVK
ncbi:MAG TPA: efflux RND transporter periplasmic adaptor subunit [Myxococcota bacterium]